MPSSRADLHSRGQPERARSGDRPMCAREAGRSVAGMTRIALLTGAVCLAVAAPATAEPVNGRISFSTFESGPAQGTGDIWTMNPDGGGRLQAVFDPLDDAQTDWAPDGNRIVFRNRRNNSFQVAIIDFTVRDAATGRPRITDVPAAADGTQSSQPAWFPDGSRRLLYRRTNAPVTTRSDIWAMNTDGTRSPADRGPARRPVLSQLLARHEQAAVRDGGSARRPLDPGHGCRHRRRHDAVRLHARELRLGAGAGRPTAARSPSRATWTATWRST